jgi:hypothetical protein
MAMRDLSRRLDRLAARRPTSRPALGWIEPDATQEEIAARLADLGPGAQLLTWLPPERDE